MTSVSNSDRIRPPAPVLDITRELERHGFEAWCVGGALRDAILGHQHLDWDIATNATPDQVRTVFGRKRTVPVGIDFGTVGVLDPSGVMHEVTTFRRDVKTDGRHAVVEFGVSLDEDLARRDFTVNALAYSPSRDELRDPYNGREDLQNRLIRAVGDPAERMREDRLRALRAIRFAARFGFQIDPATWDAVRGSGSQLTRLSAERVKQELEKTMDQVAQPSTALKLWRDSGASGVLLPELSNLSAEALEALDHTAPPGLKGRPARRLTRLAVLLSDVPSAKVGALAARLRFSNADAQWIAALVERWQALDQAMSKALTEGRAEAVSERRWVARVGRLHLPQFFRLAEARWSARRNLRAASDVQAPTARAVQSLYRRASRTALRDPLDVRDLAIDGDDLRQLGIEPGPKLGRILAGLLDRVLDDPRLNTRESLLEAARTIPVQSK